MHRMLKMLLSVVAMAALLAVPASAQRIVDLPQTDRMLAGSPDAVFTVGVDEGESHEVFSIVQGVAFDGAGNLYVLDRDNSRVVVFGPDGSFLRVVGSRGQGPGELQLPTAMAVLSDDRLAIFDLGNMAVSIFGADGEYQDIVRPEAMGRMPAPGGGGIAAHASGGFLLTANPFIGGGPGGGPLQARETVPIMLQPIDGGEAKLMFEAPTAAMEIRAGGGAGNQNVQIAEPPVFSARVSWAPLGDGRIAVSYGQDYRVSIVAAEGGSVASVLQRPIKSREVSEADRDVARKAARERMESGEGQIRVHAMNGRRSVSMGGPPPPDDQIERYLAQLRFAEIMSVIRQIRADRDNRIWVQRDGGSGSTDYPIDILHASGRYIGTVEGMELPDAIGPNGLLAFIETDDVGVQRVAVKRVPAGWFR